MSRSLSSVVGSPLYRNTICLAALMLHSRCLRVIVTPFQHRPRNLSFNKLLPDVVTIADEVDAQLKQQMLRFMAADAAKLAKGN
jgi:hypothetical protein